MQFDARESIFNWFVCSMEIDFFKHVLDLVLLGGTGQNSGTLNLVSDLANGWVQSVFIIPRLLQSNKSVWISNMKPPP